MSGPSIFVIPLSAASCVGSPVTPADRIREEFARKGSVEAEKIKGWVGDREGKFSQDLARAINTVTEGLQSRGVIDVEEKDKFKDAPPVYQTVVEDLRDRSPFMAQFKRLLGNATTWCLREKCEEKRSDAKRRLVLENWESTQFLSDSEKAEFAKRAFDYLEAEHPYWDQTEVADSIVLGAIASVDRNQLPAGFRGKLLGKAKYHYEKGEREGDDYWTDIIHYEKAVRLAPDKAGYHYSLGMEQGYPLRGFRLRSAVLLEPHNALYQAGLAEFYFENRQYQEALDHHHKALELEPNNAEYHYDVASDLHELGKREEAVRYHQEAVKLEPGNARYQYFLSVALESVGRFSEALLHAQKAVELEPTNARYERRLKRLLDLLSPKPEPAPRAAAAPKPVATPKPSGGWGF